MPRMSIWASVAAVLVAAVAAMAPHQLPLLVYKLAAATLAATAGYWVDRGIFPYARPHITPIGLVQGLLMLRRAIIVLAVVLGVCLGL